MFREPIAFVFALMLASAASAQAPVSGPATKSVQRPAAAPATSPRSCASGAFGCAPASRPEKKGDDLYRVSPAAARLAESESSSFQFVEPEPLMTFRKTDDTHQSQGSGRSDRCAKSIKDMRQAAGSDRGQKESQARDDCRGVSFGD
jgi:hypothetical protein